MSEVYSFGNFAGLCKWAKCTPEEREALAWHLAMYRARRTYEALK